MPPVSLENSVLTRFVKALKERSAALLKPSIFWPKACSDLSPPLVSIVIFDCRPGSSSAMPQASGAG
ncbi:MAG: hypothetical protein ACREU7_15950, partial [Burkholderiales bacterium]